jgi:hypothetical protein
LRVITLDATHDMPNAKRAEGAVLPAEPHRKQAHKQENPAVLVATVAVAAVTAVHPVLQLLIIGRESEDSIKCNTQ